MSSTPVISDISVLWISKAEYVPGMKIIPHTHDYFHFSLTTHGSRLLKDGTVIRGAVMSCAAPDQLHAGVQYLDNNLTYNVMFTVRDKDLYKAIETFPFHKLIVTQEEIARLESIFTQISTLRPDPAFVNAAISYYIRLLLAENAALTSELDSVDLAARCKKYIQEHYMEPFKLEDLAEYVGKNPSYTSAVFSSTCGITIIEYLNTVRIKKACNMIAYSDTPLSEIEQACGFNNRRNFCRVFREYVGTTPSRYRSSPAKKDLRADVSPDTLIASKYESGDSYTYIVNAQKEIVWDNAYDYMMQQPGASEDF